MNDINSETHSWTHSLASFAIFPLGGIEFFMILATLAMGKKISCSRKGFVGWPTAPSRSSSSCKLRPSKNYFCFKQRDNPKNRHYISAWDEKKIFNDLRSRWSSIIIQKPLQRETKLLKLSYLFNSSWSFKKVQKPLQRETLGFCCQPTQHTLNGAVIEIRTLTQGIYALYACTLNSRDQRRHVDETCLKGL